MGFAGEQCEKGIANDTEVKLLLHMIYSFFEKGCLTNGEKLTRQCRKLLRVTIVFTVA